MVSHEQENGEALTAVQAVLHVLPALGLYSKRIEAIAELASEPVPLSVTEPRSGLPGLPMAAAVGFVLSTWREETTAEVVVLPTPSVAVARRS